MNKARLFKTHSDFEIPERLPSCLVFEVNEKAFIYAVKCVKVPGFLPDILRYFVLGLRSIPWEFHDEDSVAMWRKTRDKILHHVSVMFARTPSAKR